jgi:DMSO/TMAO reductase YedYZ molybdopterin-dependent catalytic subunit
MTPEEEKLQRIVAARMRLRDRFFERMKRTPGASDERPQGSGPPNQHGMPKLPVGQRQVISWPVLDLGAQPTISLAKWSLQVDGAVEEPVTLSWDDFQKLPQTENVRTFTA